MECFFPSTLKRTGLIDHNNIILFDCAFQLAAVTHRDEDIQYSLGVADNVDIEGSLIHKNQSSCDEENHSYGDSERNANH